MLDTIFIGMSGLTGYSKGLRVIGNNLTNVNTPGFKQSELQFANMFYQGSASGAGGNTGGGAQLGNGLTTLATTLNLKAGELHQTGGDLDLAVNGEGFFVLKDGEQERYTRAGQFRFDSNGYLVSATSGARVASLDGNGKLQDIMLDGLRSNPPKATTTVKLQGNLSAAAPTDLTLNGVTIIDAVGREHLIRLTFKNNSATAQGNWTVTASDDTGTITTGTLQFGTDGTLSSGFGNIAFSYAPAGVAPFNVSLDFSQNVTANAAGTTVSVQSQDGYVAGALTKVSFDDEGSLVATYSNGQTQKGARLAMAHFSSDRDIEATGGNEFVAANGRSVQHGYAKTQSFGSLSAGVIEGANVDMAEEFSNLIVMQRGYQASSHVISTANDMIQELFDMKGHR